MNVTKAQLADLFEASTRTITTWQSQGMPVVAGDGNGGKGGEEALQPGTIDYERHRLTCAPADGQERKNAKVSAEVVETGFCMFVLSKVAGEMVGILDGIWTDPTTVDISCPHDEACSKASGLTPPR
ncbi:terminase small subunit [Serratia sp. NA_112.1]|uniref:terminase small subunit n=1 Tax=Serratia sp. NA_112.1 TaxID=3415665 RepID=UPI004046D82D